MSAQILFVSIAYIPQNRITIGQIKSMRKFVNEELEGTISFIYDGDNKNIKVVCYGLEPVFPELFSQYGKIRKAPLNFNLNKI